MQPKASLAGDSPAQGWGVARKRAISIDQEHVGTMPTDADEAVACQLQDATPCLTGVGLDGHRVNSNRSEVDPRQYLQLRPLDIKAEVVHFGDSPLMEDVPDTYDIDRQSALAAAEKLQFTVDAISVDLVCEAAEHLGISIDLYKRGFAWSRPSSYVQVGRGRTMGLQFSKAGWVGLDTYAMPAEAFFEKERVAEGDAVIGTNIDKQPIAKTFEKVLVQQSVLLVLAMKVHPEISTGTFSTSLEVGV